MQNFIVGTRVASYDFPGNKDCFVIGTVTGVNIDTYSILVEKQIFDGRVIQGIESLVGNVVHPPLNGLEGMFGLTCGVVDHPSAS